jgi:hypothetical protein
MMPTSDPKGLRLFPVICWLSAGYFFWAFLKAVGVPPVNALNASSGSFLGLALFLFLIPEAKKLKFGQLFEYEAKVKEVKEEVKQFRRDSCNPACLHELSLCNIEFGPSKYQC